MSERSDADALATAGNLTDAMTTLAGEVQRLRTSGKRTWKFVLFDIALTIGVAVFGFVAVQANTTATQNGQRREQTHAATCSRSGPGSSGRRRTPRNSATRRCI